MLSKKLSRVIPLLSVACALSIPALIASQPVPLVEDGNARATLIVPPEAGPQTLKAVDDFQYHVRKLTGVPLAKADSAEGVEGTKIIVGGKVGEALTDLEVGYDGYIIRTTPEGDLILAGRTDAGTRNAIYGLLQDHIGMRWFYPGEIGVYWPEIKDRTLILSPIDETNRPRFAHRNPWYNGWIYGQFSPAEKEQYIQWTDRNRGTGVNESLGHEWNFAVPPDKYFESNPEYYSLVGGRRQPLQLNTANQEVVEIYVDYVKKLFRDNSDQMTASLSPNDGTGWDESEEALAVSDDLVTRNLVFMNQIAERVAEEFPDRRLNFYAYADMVHLPKDPSIRSADNLMPWVAQYSMDQINPVSDPTIPVLAKFRDTLLGWSRLSEIGLGLRTYASWWSVPCAEIRRIAMDSRFFASMNAKGNSREYLDLQYGTHLLKWAEHQLLWNPDVEYEELLRDFFPKFYGPAGVAMAEVYGKLAERQATSRPYPMGQLTGNAADALEIFPRPYLEAAVEGAKNALQSVKGMQPYEARIQRELLALEAALGWADAYEAQMQFTNTGSQGDREDLIAKLQTLVSLQNSMPDHFVIAGASVIWAREQLHHLATPRTKITQPGPWTFDEHANSGGSVRAEAESVTGGFFSDHGLVLSPGREGEVVYLFEVADGLVFSSGGLSRLHVYLPDENRIEVAIEDEEFETISENTRHSSWTDEIDLSEKLAGKKSFRVRISAKNNGLNDSMFLDNFGAYGEIIEEENFKTKKEL